MPIQTQLTLDLPMSESARQLLLAQLEVIRDQARLTLGEDQAISIAAVHDLRVALRRNLAVLEAYAGWLDPEWVRKIRKRCRKLLKPLGALRDLDVLAERAAVMRPNLVGREAVEGTAGLPESSEPPDSQNLTDSQELPRMQHAPGLSELLGLERRKLRAKLPKLLDGRDFHKWLGRLSAELSTPEAALWLARPAFSKRGEVRLFRLQECMPILLYSGAARLTAYHAITLDPAGDVPDDTLHRLRVAAKNFRYILEAHQSVLGDGSRQMIKEFKDFQDLLGNWHDAVTALAYLNRLKKHGADIRSQVDVWQKPWQDRRAEMRAGFLEKWPELTAAWFHQRISACLD